MRSHPSPSPPARASASLCLCASVVALLCVAAADPVEPSQRTVSALGQDAVVVDARTETVIRGALKYLAAQQNANGSWDTGSGESYEVAMTGYVLIAFLTAGQLPDEGEYGRHVTNGLNFLLNSVKGDGTFASTGGHYMYGHGIATIALAELYGQTKDARIRPKLEHAVRVIISSQNSRGGWRYQPRVSDDDISVSVLQVVALRAAKNAGLEVPQATIDRAVKYIRSCHHRNGGFNYQPGGGDPGFARSAAAIYSLQVCGQYDDPLVKLGSEYIQGRWEDRQWFTYGHFYAAPAQYMIGGETWRSWYGKMRDKLVPAAETQGDLVHWEPMFDQERGTGPVYCTAVYTMILAMPYHYLPLYQR